MKVLRRAAIAFLAFYVVLLGALYAVMRDPAVFGRVMSKIPGPLIYIFPFKPLWFVARAGHLKVGDLSPDFALQTSDKKLRVQLSSFRGQKPVVLIFGSYT